MYDQPVKDREAQRVRCGQTGRIVYRSECLAGNMDGHLVLLSWVLNAEVEFLAEGELCDCATCVGS